MLMVVDGGQVINVPRKGVRMERVRVALTNSRHYLVAETFPLNCLPLPASRDILFWDR